MLGSSKFQGAPVRLSEIFPSIEVFHKGAFGYLEDKSGNTDTLIFFGMMRNLLLKVTAVFVQSKLELIQNQSMRGEEVGLNATSPSSR